MAKQVKNLKEKHQTDLWVDKDGEVWFFNCDIGGWYVLTLCCEGYDPGGANPIAEYGPYTRINR
ncbi:hypothetical protein SEA_BAZZLE_76 [Mycobacterium phage Bazzle]